LGTLRATGGWLLNRAILLLIAVLAGTGAWYWWLALCALPDACERVFQPFVQAAVEQGLEPMIVEMEFVLNLQDENPEAAYGLTSRAFQQRQSFAEFAGFVERHPGIRSKWINLEGEQPSADIYLFNNTTEMNGERRFEFTLRLCKEEGKWKVDEIILP
jgi:hypothetical protein